MLRTDWWENVRMMKRADKIEDMIRVFEPFPLMKNEDFQEFYVRTYEARGTDAVKHMALGLRYSSNVAMKILFMGHRGSGKSTELFLLKKEIEDQFEVINFFIEEEVDVDSMTYTDFIFAIMSQIVKYVEKKTLLHELLREDIEALYKYWNEERVFETVETTSNESETGFEAKLSFLKRIAVYGSGVLRTGNETKLTIRKTMEPKIGYLIQLMNQIITKINDRSAKNGLVFIIEDLDKISISVANEIFIKYRKVIFSIKTRMVLSFPIYMAYDAQYNMIKEDVDMCQMLSIIKVRDRKRREFSNGIDTLKEIVRKRADIGLFSEEALHLMILKSGGAIRDLFQMIRDAAFEALVAGRTQISLEDAQTAYKKLKSEYERLIRAEVDVEKLISIYEEPRPLTTDDTVMSLLLRGLVLEYNGERWCGLHPAVEDFLREKGKIGEILV